MLNLPIEWTAIADAMVDFAAIPIVPAIAAAVIGIGLVVFLIQQIQKLFGSGGE